MQKTMLLLFILCVLTMPAVQAQPDTAAQYIKFIAEPDADSNSDCSQRGGLRVFVINEHPAQIIDLQIDRYFSEVRQAGRSMFALHSGHRLALGCDIVMDSQQRWELVSAAYISKHQAKQRYGEIY